MKKCLFEKLEAVVLATVCLFATHLTAKLLGLPSDKIALPVMTCLYMLCYKSDAYKADDESHPESEAANG